MTHYIYGSGMSDCLYDYGPYYARTVDDAVRALVDTFDGVIPRADIHRMAGDLRVQRIHYFTNPRQAGADYAEITECRCAHPEYHEE